jgi:hypothetical protein
MGLLHRGSRLEGDYLTHFHAGHGNGWAALAWDLRGLAPRDVMVLRSDRGFAEPSADPSADPQQTLVYRGVERHAKVMDAGLTNDIAYYYSVFSLDDGGQWHSELRTTVAPTGGEAHWKRAGVEDEGDSLAKWAKLNFDIATLRRDELAGPF